MTDTWGIPGPAFAGGYLFLILIPIALTAIQLRRARAGKAVDAPLSRVTEVALLAGGPIRVVEPIGYREFLGLASASAFLVSDSGGVQEEASIVKRPVLVVRASTERPEVLGTFAELVSDTAAIGRGDAGSRSLSLAAGRGAGGSGAGEAAPEPGSGCSAIGGLVAGAE